MSKDSHHEAPQEQNRLIRVWIWLWYNDVTRLATMLGLPLIPLAIALNFLGVNSELIRSLVMAFYIALLCLMLIFNDYKNLNRIGLDVYRIPLRPSQKMPDDKVCSPCHSTDVCPH